MGRSKINGNKPSRELLVTSCLRRQTKPRDNDLVYSLLTQPVPGSQMVGKKRKKKAREKLAGREKGKREGRESVRRPCSPQFPQVLFSCLHFLNSADPGKRKKGRERERPPPLLSPVSSGFIFVFALSQFSGPDYLGAWNRLLLTKLITLHGFL